MEHKNVRLGHISKTQKEALVDFMESNPQLIRQKVDNNLTNKQSAKLWEDGARILNAIPGACKPWKSWRKCWRDIKNDVRQKLSKKKKHETGTGGGQESDIVLTDVEDRVSILIDEVTISGHQHVPESAANMEFPLNDTNGNVVYDEEITAITNVLAPPLTTGDVTTAEKIYPVLMEICNDSDGVINFTETSVNQNFSTPIPRKRKRNVAAQRVTHTLDSVDRITETVKEKNNVKEKYYSRKLALMERTVKAKERSNRIRNKAVEANLRIAAGIERIAESLVNN